MDVPLLFGTADVGLDGLDRFNGAILRVDGQSKCDEPLHLCRVRLESRPTFEITDLIGPQQQPSGAGHRRILLPDRSCCRVARVDVGRFAVVGLAFVEFTER